jgi:hypothetical protein
MRIDRNKKSFFVPSVKLFFIIKMSNPLLWFYLNVKCQLYDRRIKKLVKSESRNNACASLHIRDVTILLRLSALVNATRMTTGVRLNMSK